MYRPESERHYFYVGRSGLLAILNVINLRSSYFGGGSPILDVYDFGCGHGRVCRWIRSAFPNAMIHVTDYNKTAVEFCVDAFSCVDTRGEIPANSFDIIWLGSVFTHLPEDIVRDLLRRLAAGLRQNGVLIFTSQGRYSIERMKGFDWENDKRAFMHYFLGKAAFDKVASMYEQTGYGFIDYQGKTNYGVAIVSHEWYYSFFKPDRTVTQIMFQEKGSDNHQDISAYMRCDLTDDRKGPLF